MGGGSGAHVVAVRWCFWRRHADHIERASAVHPTTTLQRMRASERTHAEPVTYEACACRARCAGARRSVTAAACADGSAESQISAHAGPRETGTATGHGGGPGLAIYLERLERTVLHKSRSARCVGVGPQLRTDGCSDEPSQLDGASGAVRAEHVRETC